LTRKEGEKLEKVLQKKTVANGKSEPPVIEIKNVKKIYRMGSERICAVDDVNFEINKGEFCCLLGTSGSGKSTLLNLMAGIEKASGGQILIKGKDVRKMSEKQLAKFRQKYLGFVFQSYNLLNSMTALENVEFPLVFKRVPGRKRRKMAKDMLIKVGLGGRINHRPKQMSGGQQQRVGIARAFVAKPEIVFADEPTGNLDTRTTMEVMKLIKQIARDNRQTIVMVTHDPRLADFADKIIRILDGKIQSVDLVEHPIDEFGDAAEQTATAKEENSGEAKKETLPENESTVSEEKPAEITVSEAERAVSSVLENSGNETTEQKEWGKTKEQKQEKVPAQENKKKEAGQK
jgi:putative ABC transport system ATP-binding protein